MSRIEFVVTEIHLVSGEIFEIHSEHAHLGIDIHDSHLEEVIF